MSENNCRIEIGGKEVDHKHLCNLMFVFEKGVYRPVLYKDGKRIVDHWTISINHHQPKDEHGRSA